MKLRQLAGIALVAGASFAMVSTSAMAAHHASNKGVKCAVTTCKDGQACTIMVVSKTDCQKIGEVKTANAAKAPKVSSAATPATTAQTAEAQPAPQQQAAGAQTAAAAPQSQNQNQ